MLSKTNWLKVIKGAMIAGAGAALTFVSEWAVGIEWGLYAPIVTAVLSVAVNFVRKMAEGSIDDGN